ncbi:MAG: LamG-like jellyroll fold domain-containing protein [Candidatus Paceibacterota bacterium]
MKQRAFTLIELLVVIAIVGILSSVIYTNIQGLRERAKITAGIRFDSSTLHSIGDQLVGEWTFDWPLVGGLTPDTSGSGSNGTLVGSPATTTGYNNKGAYDFDGTDDYVDVGNNANLSPTQAITVTMWLYFEETSPSWLFVLGKGGFERGYGFCMNNSLSNFGFSINGNVVKAKTAISSGVWNFWVGTYDKQNVKLYKDGVLVNSVAYTADMVSVADNFRIGRAGYGSGTKTYTKGIFDDIRVYSSALSSSDIQKLYAEGVSSHPNLANK